MPLPFKLNLYIHDCKTRQTRGPFSVGSAYDLTDGSPARLLAVYNASQRSEPQFLVINRYSFGSSMAIDLSALGGSSQFWTEFGLPPSIPMSERLDSSCRTREASRKLVVAGVVSGVFGFAMIALGFVWRWRKRRSKNNKADQTAPVAPPDQELAERSRQPQALILGDNQR